MSSPSYLASIIVSKSDMYGKSVPVAVCNNLEEADALCDSLAAALPKGELSFFSRCAVLSATAPKEEVPSFVSVKSLACALAWAD